MRCNGILFFAVLDSVHLSKSAVLWAMSSAIAQTLSQPVQCAFDSQGNRVCIGTQSNKNVCGVSSFSFPGFMTTYTHLPCDDVVIQSAAPDGRLIYKRVLGGASENLPRQ